MNDLFWIRTLMAFCCAVFVGAIGVMLSEYASAFAVGAFWAVIVGTRRA